VGDGETDKADECAGGAELCGEPAEAVCGEVGFNAIGEGVGLCSSEGGGKNSITRGSALMARNGSRSAGRQERSRRRGVVMKSVMEDRG